MNRFTPTRREIRGGFLCSKTRATEKVTESRAKNQIFEFFRDGVSSRIAQTPGNDRVTKMTDSSEYLYLGLFRATTS